MQLAWTSVSLALECGSKRIRQYRERGRDMTESTKVFFCSVFLVVFIFHLFFFMHAFCLSYMPRTKHAESWSLSHIWIFVRYHLHLTSVGECRKVTPENSVSSTASFLDTLFNASSLPGFFPYEKIQEFFYSFREATNKNRKLWRIVTPLGTNISPSKALLFPGQSWAALLERLATLQYLACL